MLLLGEAQLCTCTLLACGVLGGDVGLGAEGMLWGHASVGLRFFLLEWEAVCMLT